MDSKKTEIAVAFDMVLVYAECKKADANAIADLFCALSGTGTNIDLISMIPPRRSAGGLAFSVFNCDFAKVLRATAQLKDAGNAMRIEVSGGYSKITLRGASFPHETGIAADFFNALRKADSETMLVVAAEGSLSVLMKTDALDRTVSALENAFPASETVYYN